MTPVEVPGQVEVAGTGGFVGPGSSRTPKSAHPRVDCTPGFPSQSLSSVRCVSDPLPLLSLRVVCRTPRVDPATDVDSTGWARVHEPLSRSKLELFLCSETEQGSTPLRLTERGLGRRVGEPRA